MPLNTIQRIDGVMQQQFYNWYLIHGMSVCGALAQFGEILKRSDND